ncbi:MAG: hypothetical protein CMO80_05815 [Verrucomicrobiales bacterium]|nr:hypothetical protein [Verrucomicrobiales bacterium]|tara:strand:- start:2121 stop:2480 length:360 start_codon:yes stop_codon:yes gene_type:complete
MGEDLVDQLIARGDLPSVPCQTYDLPIPATQSESRNDLLHPDLPIFREDIRHAVNNTMARTVEDILSRRTRCLYLDARACVAIAPEVAKEMAVHLRKKKAWVDEQTHSFRKLAARHLCD